jgi:F420-dependent oxidoreductase-like protein
MSSPWARRAACVSLTGMKIGCCISNFSWDVAVPDIRDELLCVARFADDAGFDSLWTMDHFFQIRVTGEPPEAPMLEAYATLAFIAGQTRRINLGTCVTSVAYRHPGVLIKTVTTLDVLSGGRIVFGVGAGAPWNGLPPGVSPRDVEYTALGIPFPSLRERFERLEEVLQIARQMWSDDEGPFTGAHYELLRTLNSPAAVQRPHPRILVAGSGERKTLPLVARYGDMCNLFDLPGTGFHDDLAHKLAVLRRHCDEIGRDESEIEKTVSSIVDFGDDADAAASRFVDHLHELASVGIDHVLVSPATGPWDQRRLDAIAAILPAVHEIERAPVVR